MVDPGGCVQQSVPEVLISEAEIKRRVGELAAQISHDYQNATEVVLVGVLKGAFIFLADLARQLTIPRTIEFIALSSYDNASSAGPVRMLMDVRASLIGKHVILVEDIVDTGRTLRYLREMFSTRSPASVRACALVRKADRAQVNVSVDYLGFDIPDVWVVGYGLDYAERDRTLPYIGRIEVHD
jgi:hypoxanthine phosphoribosyltransferase